jgi:hypothetical protein
MTSHVGRLTRGDAARNLLRLVYAIPDRRSPAARLRAVPTLRSVLGVHAALRA